MTLRKNSQLEIHHLVYTQEAHTVAMSQALQQVMGIVEHCGISFSCLALNYLGTGQLRKACDPTGLS